KEPSLHVADIERTVQAFLQRTPAPTDTDLQALDSEIRQVCAPKSSKNSNNGAGATANGGGAASVSADRGSSNAAQAADQSGERVSVCCCEPSLCAVA